ncbi:Tfp type 4 fimbrial pilin related signal peptide protein domain protein [Legionella gratiana]|uniref:Type II secretion system protein H n=1 Tax=Legionella gratiana TaxID=45066 RepID=A0A378JDL6_9GAMM|nr:GspH/FimT family pseudopilin [Legionella gratiana]KTD15618.1 Tfp type 4 fimbrial pilin related signal peptide protein domain protein [Legionella gratiana]STX44967.1 Tfp type 4 fimbrial pilin related signal peptide protein domain [Legionella gratiana]
MMKAIGFTLLELLITMTLVVALLMISISSYSYFIKKNEQQVIIDELRTALQYAKIQAMILDKPVFLVPLDTSMNWSKGITLNYLNKKTNQLELIYQWQWNYQHWSLNWVGVSSKDKIIFSNNPTQAISNGRFNLINNNTQEQMTLILNRLGRIRVSNNLSLKQ